MAKQSVLGAPQAPKGGAPRSGFSRSQNFTFTAAAAMLLPTYREFLNYGEHVSGIPKCFIRTEPLLAPAMADLDVFVDVFFVPMTHLVSMYDSWFTQVSDDKSALWNNSVWKNHLPVLDKPYVVDNVTKHAAFGWMTPDIFIQPNHIVVNSSDAWNWCGFGFDLHRLTNMLGYNAQGLFVHGVFDYDTYPADSILPEYVSNAKNLQQDPFVPYFYQAYQKIYFDYYRDSQYEANNVKAYNIDDEMNAGNDLFAPTSASDPRLGMFKLRYRNRSKDYFMAVHPSPLFNGMGMLPNAMANLSRIRDWLSGQTPSIISNTTTMMGVPQSVGLSQYLDLDGTGTLNTAYNGPYKTSSGAPLQITGPAYLGPNGDDEGVMTRVIDGNPVPAYHSHPVSLYEIAHNLNIDNTPISLAQMRTAFALDKLLRITNRAGKHVDDQILAEFGVKIPQGVSGEVYKLKSYHTLFHIGEVVQSATTVDSAGNDVPLGEMAGRGVALLNGNETFEFTAPCSGILMSIMSIMPRYKYVFGQEKDGYKTYIEDFFRPQHDGLGMQPVLGFELGFGSGVTTAWQYRYMEDKIKFDKAAPVFATISKNPWSFSKPVYNSYYNSKATSDYTSLGLCWQKGSPQDLNNLFVVQYDGCPDFPSSNPIHLGMKNYRTPVGFLSAYLTDPFIVDFEMSMTKVSQMSTYGEPSLGGI